MSKMKIIFPVIVFLYITQFASNAFSKTYKIGCIEDYYPYISINTDGEPEGIIIDWWNLWSFKTGVDIVNKVIEIKPKIVGFTASTIESVGRP